MLGGIADAIQIATLLSKSSLHVIYSISGLVRKPELDCEVRIGGFGGAEGLSQYLQTERIDLVIDATHPYADNISRNASTAALLTNIPCWQYVRPGFAAEVLGEHERFITMERLIKGINRLKRPFFATGKGQFSYLSLRPTSQHWLIRTAMACPAIIGCTIINGIGPFTVEQEFAFLQKHQADGLVSKDGGSIKMSAKFTAAKQLSLPVFILDRPSLPQSDRFFTKPDALVAAVLQEATL